MATGKSAGRISLIDGWRGVSVLMVIVSHVIVYRTDIFPLDALNSLGFALGTKLFALIGSLGTLGVCFFFMISGYLITHLLVAEETKRNRISLRAFYVRRVFRIMPAFYAYVLTVYLLGRADLVLVDDEAVFRSSVYICNFSGYSCSWWLAHTWSLAVEEQFYLVWPMIFAFAASWRREVAIGLVTGLFIGAVFVSSLGSFVYIMIGSLVALSPGLRHRLSAVRQTQVWLALGLLVAIPAAPQGLATIANLAHPVLAAIAMFGTVFGASTGFFHNAMQHTILTKIGLISYSLYLWQQLSLAPDRWGGAATGADVLYGQGDVVLALAFIPIAIASYFVIEKPMVSLGHRLSRRILERHDTRELVPG